MGPSEKDINVSIEILNSGLNKPGSVYICCYHGRIIYSAYEEAVRMLEEILNYDTYEDLDFERPITPETVTRAKKIIDKFEGVKDEKD